MPAYPYVIYPLGDGALTASFSERIDPEVNDYVIGLWECLRGNLPPGWREVSFAYSSLSVFFDPLTVRKSAPGATAFEAVKNRLEAEIGSFSFVKKSEERLKDPVRIPVWYGGGDLPAVCAYAGLSAREAIALHCSRAYRVYFTGFLPGFAYMGLTPERLQMPRKPNSVPTRAGAVGLADLQTGVYPLDSPGGWQIIGYTPLKMYDERRERPLLLQAGDYAQFYPIEADEYIAYKSRSA